MAATDHSREALTRIVAERHVHRVGGVLQALREICLEHGHIEHADEHAVADVFNLSQAEVRGIVSFYHDLKTTPQPPLTVKVCQAEACQAVGGREFTDRVRTFLGLELGQADGRVALEPVYCLGLCAQGPSMMVGERPVARADQCDLATEIGA